MCRCMACHRSSLANIAWSEEMSVKLDELRRRLLQQEQPSDQNQPDDQQPQVLTYSPRREAVPPAPTPKEIAAPPIAPESLPQPEPPQIPPPLTPRQARPREAATPISAGEHQLSQAVAKVFEQTE